MAETLIASPDQDQGQGQDEQLIRQGAKNQKQLIRVQPEQKPAVVNAPSIAEATAPSIAEATAGTKPAAMPDIAAPATRPTMGETKTRLNGLPQERLDAQAQGKLIPGTYHTDPKTGMQVETPYSYAQQANPFAGVFAHADNIHNPILRTLAKIGAGVGTAAYGIGESQHPELVAARRQLIEMPGEEAKTQAETEHLKAETANVGADKAPAPEQQASQSKLTDSRRLGEIEQLMQSPGMAPEQKTALENEQKQIYARQPSMVPPARETAAQPAGAQATASFHSQLPGITPHLSAGERAAYEFPAGYQPTAKEITEMASRAHEAEQTALSEKREDRAAQTAQAQADKKSLEDRVIETAAQSIASMDVKDLSRLRDITTMRGDQRTLVYARAKEINPKFNTGEVDRKIKMMDSFTNGKDGQNLQSFGTFLEHAGEANRVVQEIRQGATPKLLNTALNKMEKEGYGTTATQISAALEPVRKEFEGFLLGGRALYAEDRKAAETILSNASTPAQIQVALKQMGHTVSARYTEMGTRFKGTMGATMEDTLGPLSPEAHSGARDIGLDQLGGYKYDAKGAQGPGWYQK